MKSNHKNTYDISQAHNRARSSSLADEQWAASGAKLRLSQRAASGARSGRSLKRRVPKAPVTTCCKRASSSAQGVKKVNSEISRRETPANLPVRGPAI